MRTFDPWLLLLRRRRRRRVLLVFLLVRFVAIEHPFRGRLAKRPVARDGAPSHVNRPVRCCCRRRPDSHRRAAAGRDADVPAGEPGHGRVVGRSRGRLLAWPADVAGHPAASSSCATTTSSSLYRHGRGLLLLKRLLWRQNSRHGRRTWDVPLVHGKLVVVAAACLCLLCSTRVILSPFARCGWLGILARLKHNIVHLLHDQC